MTNYVMLELGQPLHAFDADRIRGGIQVRRALAGETCKLLDAREVSLDPEFLVIADDGGALALAGVMGGFDSRITDATPASFPRARILHPRRSAGARGVSACTPMLRTVSSVALIRNCRVWRWNAPVRCCLRSRAARPGRWWKAASMSNCPACASFAAQRAAEAHLGIEIDADQVGRILAALGMQVVRTADGWQVSPPSWRFDIEIEEDLVEEVARIHGYDHIPTVPPRGSWSWKSPVNPVWRWHACVNAWWHTTMPRQSPLLLSVLTSLQRWGMAEAAITLANPLSADLAVMRTSLLPGLVAALKRNLNRQASRVRLFIGSQLPARR